MGTQPIEEPENWLVGRQKNRPNISLLHLYEEMKKDRQIRVRNILGPENDPDLLVIETTETVVKRYRDKVGDKYRFEENKSVHY